MKDSTVSKNMDVMQHIKNLYNIIGADSKDDKSIIDMIKQNSVNIQIDWYGTAEEYRNARAKGEITPTMNCYITDDDDFDPTK